MTSAGDALRLRAVRGLAWPLIALAGCSGAAAAETPEQAFATFAAAAREPELRGTFEALDLQSRWAVISIRRAEREMHALVRAHYPSGAREREMARYSDAAKSDEPAAYFVRQYRSRIEELRPALSGTPRIERGSDGRSAMVLTPSGSRLAFAIGDDGRWGWAGLRDELEARKIWSANALETVHESSSRYRR